MTANYAFSKSELRENLHKDIRLMLAFYIGDEIELEIPEMHSEIWDEFLVVLEKVNSPEFIVGILKKLLAIPRGHAKTTLVKLAILLLLRYSKLGFCAYVSNTAPIAHNALFDIVAWFMSENDKQLFGESFVVRKSEKEQLFILDIAVPGQTQRKRVILKAFGQGTQIRGTVIANRRPDLLVFDDIESRETVESELQQTRLDNWATGTALQAMAARGFAVFIGNMISKTSLLARLSKDRTWNPTVLGAVIKLPSGEYRSLWPARWSLESLIEQYHNYISLGLAHVWEAELMNLTSDDILGESLQEAWTPLEPTPDQIDSGFICLDPAFGLNSWNDFSGITVHVRKKEAEFSIDGTPVERERPMLVRVITKRASPEDLFDMMLEQTYYWGVTTWVIESVAAQRLLFPLFQTYLRDRKIPDGVISMVPITGGRESKASRIVAFRKAVAQHAYGITQENLEFRQKLEGYTPVGNKEHDDDLDSAAFGLLSWAMLGQTLRSRTAGMQLLGILMQTAHRAGGNTDDFAVRLA